MPLLLKSLLTPSFNGILKGRLVLKHTKGIFCPVEAKGKIRQFWKQTGKQAEVMAL